MEVSGAILVHDNKILCAQRGKGKYDYISFVYEFPGGKLEEGETPEEALQRELIEEMDLYIPREDMEFFYTVDHQYPDFRLVMHTFICPVESAEVTLKEHVSAVWLPIDELDSLNWAPADRPIVHELMENFHGTTVDESSVVSPLLRLSPKESIL